MSTMVSLTSGAKNRSDIYCCTRRGVAAPVRRGMFGARMHLNVAIALIPLLMGLCSGFASHVAPGSPFTRKERIARSLPLMFGAKLGTTWRERFHSGPLVLDQSDEHRDDPVHDGVAIIRSESNPVPVIDGNEADTDLLNRRKQTDARVSVVAKVSPTPTATSRLTSFGSRREVNPTINRQGASTSSKILKVLRKTAQCLVSDDMSSDKLPTDTEKPSLVQVSQSVIYAAVDEILRSRDGRPSVSIDDTFNINAAFSYFGMNMGVLGEATTTEVTNRCEEQSAFILSASHDDRVSVRVATPIDDADIATLRLSVFSDFVPDMQAQFCARSRQAITARRLRGSTCIVATQMSQELSQRNEAEKIVGSAECSFHEFYGTQLGQRRAQHSILYLTEVAVNPHFHRQGIGSKILRAVDIIAERRGVETLYLHVDVQNHGALRLYENAGYSIVYSTDSMFLDFTTCLNLHPGATRGRVHFLLYKNLAEPIWLNDVDEKHITARPSKGSIGIEIPT